MKSEAPRPYLELYASLEPDEKNILKEGFLAFLETVLDMVETGFFVESFRSMRKAGAEISLTSLKNVPDFFGQILELNEGESEEEILAKLHEKSEKLSRIIGETEPGEGRSAWIRAEFGKGAKVLQLR